MGSGESGLGEKGTAHQNGTAIPEKGLRTRGYKWKVKYSKIKAPLGG